MLNIDLVGLFPTSLISFLKMQGSSLCFNILTMNTGFKVPQISKLDMLFDNLMKPVMWLLGGFKNDSLQETHAWHVFDFDPSNFKRELMLEFEGDDDSNHDHKNPLINFLFHAPLFGGWKKYVVIGHDLIEDIDWHVGWHLIEKDSGKTVFSQLNKLSLRDRQVKLLKGSRKYITRFFAVDSKGQQIKLKFFDEGMHGDRKHKHLRFL